jgi:hypothetical protein
VTLFQRMKSDVVFICVSLHIPCIVLAQAVGMNEPYCILPTNVCLMTSF